MHTPKLWINFSTPQAREIVRKVFLAAKNKRLGLSTREIYETITNIYPDAITTFAPPPITTTHEQPHRPKKPVPEPPQRHHPVRSVRYLKHVILKEMAKAKEVEKIHVTVGSPTKDGKHELLARSEVVGYTNVGEESSIRECWRWRLLPKFHTRIFNYPKPDYHAFRSKEGRTPSDRQD